MQIGIDSFAAAFDDSSLAVNPPDRLRHLVEQIEHADQLGLDAFGVGEHHRREFLDSAPAVILGAAAARTRQIRLTSAVTVLSAADPVRVFQNFATLDLLSQGRAEMIVGRGSSIEAFPLFGFRLEDYARRNLADKFSNECGFPAPYKVDASYRVDRRPRRAGFTGTTCGSRTLIGFPLMPTSEGQR